MPANTRYKDSVFSFLFSDFDNLRELYSAIEGVSLPPDAKIDINTLSDMLFMEQINDLSFTVGNRLIVLIEHQSSINPNMPLRLLEYIAHVYEKIINRRKLFHSKLEKIPTPEFIVLYNGKEEYPDHKELRLSDAFIDAADLRGKNLGKSLELVVQVYNINYGHNHQILEKCEALGGYSFFVGKVREYQKVLPFEEAFKRAIKYCIEHNILKQFLENHGSEVYSMALCGWDIEEARVAWREEAREAGLEEGREEGREEEREVIARNALAKGIPLDLIHEITGLNMETIIELRS